MAGAFANIALGFSQAMGGPYHAAVAHWPGKAVKDDSGRIVDPGIPIARDCSVQIDSVTDTMRGDAGYADKDVRLLILAPTLSSPLNTDAEIELLPGAAVPADWVGRWSVESVGRDPAGVGWECRGRRL